MKIDEKKLTEEFKSWKGTKWIHGQSCKGVGVDCIQLIVKGFINLNLLPDNFKTRKYNRDYAVHNEESILLRELSKYCYRVNKEDLKVGDILVYKYDSTAHHAGIYIGNNKMIHSKIRIGVMESYLFDEEEYFVSAWRLK